MNRLSIIIPVYKVEPYLRKCIDSVLAQSYANLEIILVDDGSPDGCSVICDEYSYRDNRVKVIHQSNAGVSMARNDGLFLATGDFIGFVDSDDWIEPDMYEYLMKLIVENQSDISGADFFIDRNDFVDTQVDKVSVYEHTRQTALASLVLKQDVNVNVINKVFAKKLFVDNIFPPGVPIAEDELVTIRSIAKAKIIIQSNKKVYHYITRPGSAMNTSFLNEEISNMNQEHFLYFAMMEALPEKRQYADYIQIQCDMDFVTRLVSEKRLSYPYYRIVKERIKRHLSKEAFLLCNTKYKLWIILYICGYIPFCAWENIKFKRR